MKFKHIFDNAEFVTKESFPVDYNRGTDNIGELCDRWNGKNLIAPYRIR